MNDNSHDGKLARIEDRLDRPVANAIAVQRGGSVAFHSMGEVMEFSKLMAIAQQAVPKHLRGQPGLCMGIILQAVAWEMEPFAVARKSYVVNDNLAYESQLIHAVIETRAPLRKRLRCTYSGEGGDRQCTVMGTFLGEEEPHTYTTPKLKDIPIKNSPLWRWDIDQQMFYLGSRAWARKWCPDVLLGVYSKDEAEFIGEHATPLMERIHNPLQDDADLEEPPQKVHEPERMTNADLEAGLIEAGYVEGPGGYAKSPEANPRETETSPGCGGGGPATLTNPADEITDPPLEELAAEPPRQARRKPAGEPKAEPASYQPEPDKARLGPNPALGIALEQPWIKKTVANYIDYLERWVEAWAKWGQDPNGLRDRFSAERTIRNGLGEKMTDKQLAQCRATAAGAFARLGGIPK
jgi:hypothetical protein